MVYALDGQMMQRTDQRGTVIDFTYNDRRQDEKQTASTLGGSTNGDTRAIKHEYDTLGRVEKITSYSDTSASTVTNQVVYEYDSLGQIKYDFQEHNGAKGGSTLKVGAAAVSSYQYAGTGRLVEVRYKATSVNPELYLDRGFSNGDYANLDRFGRVKSQVWKTSSTTVDRVDYTHDLASNRTSRDLSSGTLDQLYSYDGLDRVVNYDEGTIASGTIGSPTKEADWTLDGLGNWSEYEEKASGSTTLDQTRAHNAINEIGTIGANTGSNWIDPVHDEAGNMTEAPKPGSETTKHKYIWDAWNRLVKVTDSTGNTTIAEFRYDGLNPSP
jgi:YD repeat-containing protein